MSHRKIIYFSLILLLFSVCGSTAARSATRKRHLLLQVSVDRSDHSPLPHKHLGNRVSTEQLHPTKKFFKFSVAIDQNFFVGDDLGKCCRSHFRSMWRWELCGKAIRKAVFPNCFGLRGPHNLTRLHRLDIALDIKTDIMLA